MTEPSHFLTPCRDIKKWIIEGKWGRVRGQMGYTQAEGLEELCAELSLGRAGWEWAPRTSSQPQMFFSSRPSGGASSDTAWPCGSSCVPTNLSSCCASAGYGTPAPLCDLLCSALPAAAQMCLGFFSPRCIFRILLQTSVQTTKKSSPQNLPSSCIPSWSTQGWKPSCRSSMK